MFGRQHFNKRQSYDLPQCILLVHKHKVTHLTSVSELAGKSSNHSFVHIGRVENDEWGIAPQL